MIVDAHLHVWDVARASYPWLATARPTLRRSFGIGDVERYLDLHDVRAVVLIQAADNDEDLHVMSAAAVESERVSGIVAWAPLDRPATIDRALADLVDHPLVVGVRVLIHDRAPGWLLGESQRQCLAKLEQTGLTLDFVSSSPAALAEVPELGRRHPELDIVIDHLGRPPLDGGARERREWRRLVAAAAANPRIHAKLSGLAATADDSAAWTPRDARPFIDDAVDLFGPERLMFGSDWPVSTTSGGYDRALGVVVAATEDLSSNDRSEIFGGTATRFYQLERKDQREIRQIG